MALSAVLFPAPFGPMSPRMRPSSTRKSMPSKRDCCAEGLAQSARFYDVMLSALLFAAFRGLASGAASSKFLRCQSQPLNVA